MTFFDRFGPSGKRTDELDHVVQNISAILNTKEGFGSVIGQLGIGSYLARQGSRDSLETLTQEIKDCITRYEPRLQDFEMELLGKTAELYLCWNLTGRVSGKRCKLRLLFHTTFGNVLVEKVAL